ncbi:MAG TPA: rhomboid family intramembrane serine protease, partial [Anaeromyxobacteraceae bacterium]|nr:rhomboid family intramembrane serine protease [Anaeromyxobacteraceae bacterium]
MTGPGEGGPPPARERWPGGVLELLLRRRPVVTWAVTALIVATSLVAFVLPTLALRLEKENQRILAGEWWRLLTVALVHGSPLHLFFNAY